MELDGFVPAIIHLYRPGEAATYGVNLLKEQYDSGKRTISLTEPIVFRAKSAQPPYEAGRSEHPVPTNGGQPGR